MGWLTIKGKNYNKVQTVKTDDVLNSIKKKKKKSRDIPCILKILIPISSSRKAIRQQAKITAFRDGEI